MYGTVYAKITDVTSTDPKDFAAILNELPDEVIYADWKRRYELIRKRFPRNYLTSRRRPCDYCHQPFSARALREHKCRKKPQSKTSTVKVAA